MKSLFLIFIFIFTGCATKPKSKTKILEDVKQEDFKKVKMIKYRKQDDYFANAESKFSDASNSESLQRIFIYDGDISLEGELGRIAKLCYEKKFAEADIIIKDTNQKYLKNPIFWNQVGTCHLLQNERRKALLFYNKSLAIKSNYAPALNNLGVMYMYEGDFSRALVAFKKARGAKEFSRTPRINLANLYVNFGLYDKAIKELDVLYKITKSDVDVLNLIGTAYLMQGKVQDAVKFYSLIKGDFHEDPRFGINYALALYQSKQKEKAIDVFEDIEIKNLRYWKDYYNEVKKEIGVK